MIGRRDRCDDLVPMDRDVESRLLRYRVVEELVELASPADEQLAHLAKTGYPKIELIAGYLNWSYDRLIPLLDQRGALTADATLSANAVGEALLEFDKEMATEHRQNGMVKALSDDGLRTDPRWERIRGLARLALERFAEMGIPVPRLTDPDYNVARDDAPGTPG